MVGKPMARHRETALAAGAIRCNLNGLALDCFAEFTPAYEPGLAMTACPQSCAACGDGTKHGAIGPRLRSAFHDRLPSIGERDPHNRRQAATLHRLSLANDATEQRRSGLSYYSVPQLPTPLLAELSWAIAGHKPH
jgi:hypothetical protein